MLSETLMSQCQGHGAPSPEPSTASTDAEVAAVWLPGLIPAASVLMHKQGANIDLEADPERGRSCLINASAPFLLTLHGSRSPRPAHGILPFSPSWEDGFEVHFCFSGLRTCQPLLQ